MEDDIPDQKPQRVPSILEGDSQEVDDAILHAQGHEAVLARQFNWISALGLAFSVTNSWVGYLVRMNHSPTEPHELSTINTSDRVALDKIWSMGGLSHASLDSLLPSLSRA